MKEKLELLIANLRDDLENIEKIKSEYGYFTSSMEDKAPDIYQRAVIGYYLHNFYNACENAFLNIARTFENNIDPQEWHKSILKRMKLEIESIRPRAISDSLYKTLDDFRAFRHIFRHVYSFELDWQKEKIVADKLHTAIEQFKDEILAFIDTCKNMIRRSEI